MVEIRWGKQADFLRDLCIVKMEHPIDEGLYSYAASRTDIQPYQFVPVIKFLKSSYKRILIADEVGLGKTIEAAYIYIELKARGLADRTLILCPASLIQKWQAELRDRFNEEFVNLDTKGIDRLFTQKKFKAIVSYETIRRTISTWPQNQIPNIDLLICDEAHHMRNATTQLYKTIALIFSSVKSAVFLTATPLQTNNENLYNLFHLLVPHQYRSFALFEWLGVANAKIHDAVRDLKQGRIESSLEKIISLQKVGFGDLFVKNPVYHNIIAQLKSGKLSREEILSLERNIKLLLTFSNVFSRTRKREAISAAVRAVVSVPVVFDAAEMEWYTYIVKFYRERNAHPFTIVQLERQLASSLYATMKSKFQRLDLNSIHNLREQDAKFNRLITILNQCLETNPKTKILIFSTFRVTVEYLFERLQLVNYECSTIHGGIKPIDRARIIDRFRELPKIKILISSEVGSEGLDFQFCDVLINYDLPWNPMRVEQRLGRLDRFGQEWPRIKIFNFFIQNTIEARILQRLYERIGLFEQSIGDLEEILGEITEKLSHRIFQSDLTLEEEDNLSQETIDQILHQKHYQEQLEISSQELMGTNEVFHNEVNKLVEAGNIVHPYELEALIEGFFNRLYPQCLPIKDEDEPAFTLSFTPALAEHLKSYKKTSASRHFIKSMVDFGTAAFTYNSNLASRRRLLEFVTHQHMLAHAAYDFWSKQKQSFIRAACVTIVGSKKEKGEGYFFVYAIDDHAKDIRRTFHTIFVMDNDSSAPETSAKFLFHIHDEKTSWTKIPFSEERLHIGLRTADKIVAEYVSEVVSNQTQAKNAAEYERRKIFTTQFYEAQIKDLQDLNNEYPNQDERIVRLRTGQIRNLQQKRELELKNLEQDFKMPHVTYRIVVCGRIQLI
jgi:superfamily II DNA or RNA helicase